MLLRAQVQIRLGKHSHICYALNKVAEEFNDTPLWIRERDREYLKSYIMAQLDYYGTLERWQAAKWLIGRSWFERQQDRIDWIDWMLGKK